MKISVNILKNKKTKLQTQFQTGAAKKQAKNKETEETEAAVKEEEEEEQEEEEKIPQLVPMETPKKKAKVEVSVGHSCLILNNSDTFK